MNLLTIYDNTRKVTFPVSVLCLLFFFYKMARYSNKNYLILMIFVLVFPIFLSALMQSIISFWSDSIPVLMDFLTLSDKFAGLWIICLAVYHYTMLKSFKGKPKRYPYKRFIILALSSSLAITFLTNFE